MNVVRVSLNGTSYVGFKSVYIRRSLDTAAGAFKLETAIENIKDYPVKLGQTVQIYVNDTQVIDGFIEKIESSYSASQGSYTHSVFAEGRDKTCDLIDSTLDGQVTFSGAVTFENVAKRTIQSLGITGIGVVNLVPDLKPFPSKYIVSGKVGESAFTFLENLARRQSAFLTTDGKGNLVITRASQNQSGATLINNLQEKNKSNIKSATMSYDNSVRFNKYKAFSQAQFSSLNYQFDDAEKLVNINGEVTDDSIRKGRVYNFISEKNSSASECKERATWERNLRFGQASVYDVTVFGFNCTSSSIWTPNTLVNIFDDFADIRSIMLIDVVEFTQNLTDGSITKLKCIDKDAFTAKLKISQKEQENKSQGKDFGSSYRFE